jgi:putative SOS response-associated peptidase YedK
MCGRFGFDMPKEDLERAFGVRVSEPVPPSWNIAPGRPVLGVALFEGQRELMGFLWGLVPPWAERDAGYKSRGFANARSETVFEKRAFRDSVRYFRCLVPASFFYEWKREGGARSPRLIRLRGGEPMALAAIWAEPPHEGGPRPGAGREPGLAAGPGNLAAPTLAILTTAANPAMRAVHERMPVILPQREHAAWLDPLAREADLRPLLRPFDGALDIHAVSARVNDASTDNPGLARPVRPPAAQGHLPL